MNRLPDGWAIRSAVDGRPMPSVSAEHVSESRWTKRGVEILAVTLRLLQRHGYDRLTVEAVATEAKASKATVYRRWPSKADLVLAAFIEGTRIEALAPQRGSLREDLLEIGAMVRDQTGRHASTVRAVLAETLRSPALSVALHEVVVRRHEALITRALVDAADRGEIDAAVVDSEVRDLLPGYLTFRFLVPGPLPSAETVRALVDDVLMPSLTHIPPRTGRHDDTRRPSRG